MRDIVRFYWQYPDRRVEFTDGCHHAACDASYHAGHAIMTVVIGIVVVLVATGVGVFLGVARDRNIFYLPFLGLLGLAIVFMIGMAVLH